MRSTKPASAPGISGSRATSSRARAWIIAASPPRGRDIGDLQIKISGCINACGHHHVGHIGLLGVDKNGEEVYQITIGGRADENAAIGGIVGPAVKYDDV